MDFLPFIAIVVAIIVKLVILKGNFVLPTIYKNGKDVSFNLGSLGNIITAVIAALGLYMGDPSAFANPAIAFLTTISAPYLVDGVITYGTRKTVDASDVTTVYSGTEDKDYEEVA